MLQSIAYFDHPINRYWIDENYYGYVYLTYDQKTKLCYVGQKKGKIENSRNYYGSGKIISDTIKGRGTYFLKKIILGVCYSDKELTEQETECKLFFNALDPLYGYNIIKDEEHPDTMSNHPDKEKIIQEMSNTLKRRYSTNEIMAWNKGLTAETDERVAQYGKNSGKSRKGKPLSKDSVRKREKTRKENGTNKWTEDAIEKNRQANKKTATERNWRWISKNGVIKRVKFVDLQKYLNLGWENKRDITFKFMNKDGIDKQVFIEEIDFYLDQGWNLGRIPFKERNKNS